MSNWQAIETAPRDGTLVLLASVNNDEFPMRCRRWNAIADRWRGDDGWDATHWMPLPEPPEYRPPSPELIAAIAADESR